jgi:hypothetical protein
MYTTLARQRETPAAQKRPLELIVSDDPSKWAKLVATVPTDKIARVAYRCNSVHRLVFSNFPGDAAMAAEAGLVGTRFAEVILPGSNVATSTFDSYDALAGYVNGITGAELCLTIVSHGLVLDGTYLLVTEEQRNGTRVATAAVPVRELLQSLLRSNRFARITVLFATCESGSRTQQLFDQALLGPRCRIYHCDLSYGTGRKGIHMPQSSGGGNQFEHVDIPPQNKVTIEMIHHGLDVLSARIEREAMIRGATSARGQTLSSIFSTTYDGQHSKSFRAALDLSKHLPESPTLGPGPGDGVKDDGCTIL